MTAFDGIFGGDVALVHHRSGAAHAKACAPGLLERLADVRARDGLVLELGCGSGPLTAELVATGHRVIATDASEAMVALAAERVGADAHDVRRLTLPVDPLPRVDAIVAVGHPLNYLDTAVEIELALVAIARALRPGGVLALDICDLRWGARADLSPLGRAGEDWAIIIQFSAPSVDRFVRDITTFLPNDDGSWRRSRERHDSVLIDTAGLPTLLHAHGVEATVGDSFGRERLPEGLRVLTGRRPFAGASDAPATTPPGQAHRNGRRDRLTGGSTRGDGVRAGVAPSGPRSRYDAVRDRCDDRLTSRPRRAQTDEPGPSPTAVVRAPSTP